MHYHHSHPRDPRGPQPQLPHGRSLPRLSPLRDAVLECAAAQARHLAAHGAKLHELFENPLWVRVSENPKVPEVALTGRWLARGAFMAAIPHSAGRMMPGLFGIEQVLSSNPHLSPAGTIEPVPWRGHPSCAAKFMVPFGSTIAAATNGAAQEAASYLLQVFPKRIDLAPKGHIAHDDRMVLAHALMLFGEPLAIEVGLGLRNLAMLVPHSASELSSIEDEVRITVRRDLMRKALSTFRETRLHIAQFQHERYGDEGPISALVASLAGRAEARAREAVIESLNRHPFSAPQLGLLKGALRDSIKEITESDPLAKELWINLPKNERGRIAREAAVKAWGDATRRYAAGN